jgi:hypothetical protein
MNNVQELRAGAQGTDPGYRAGLELLIWLGKNVPVIRDGGLSGKDVRVDRDELLDWAGPWSGGERRIVRVAASLMWGDVVDLADVLGGLGGEHRRAVVEAVAAAAGLRVA